MKDSLAHKCRDRNVDVDVNVDMTIESHVSSPSRDFLRLVKHDSAV